MQPGITAMRPFIAAFAAAVVSVSPAFAEGVWLTMDQVRPFELKKPAGQIVIGNPAIADVTVIDKTHVMLFGKSPGLTNLYILDENGEPLDNLIVRVKTASSDMLTMHRGALRTTYTCAGNCDATSTVGDNLSTFTETNQQVQTKFQQATALGSGQN